MKIKLLEILACPKCGHDVNLENPVFDGQEVTSGSLKCVSCSALYNIHDGIPCMLLEQHLERSTQKGFTEQWEMKASGKFNIKHLYGADYNKWGNYITNKGMINADDDGWAMDAGCGSGDLSCSVAKQNRNTQVVGMDFQNAIYKNAALLKDNPNLHFVHGDVMRTPFKKKSIKLLMSHGVLHHTANTQKAFESISELVMDGGFMSLWLYPHFFECGPMMKSLYVARDFLFLRMGHHLPSKPRYFMSKAFTTIFFPVVIILGLIELNIFNRKKKIDHKNKNSTEDVMPIATNLNFGEFYRTHIFVVYDNITPKYQFRHKKYEVFKWYKDNNFTSVQSDSYYPGYYWGEK